MIGKPGVEVRLTLRQSCPGKAPRTSIVIARQGGIFGSGFVGRWWPRSVLTDRPPAVFHGTHSIYTGPTRESHLILPIAPRV